MSELCASILFVLFCVWVEALRWADPPSKGSYRLCIGLKNKNKFRDFGPQAKYTDRVSAGCQRS
jgi:hypothetical protein